MRAFHRWPAVIPFGALGVLTCVILSGGMAAGCHRPVGWTAIQCARSTGIYPTVGVGLAVLAGTILLALLLTAAIVGAAMGLVARPVVRRVVGAHSTIAIAVALLVIGCGATYRYEAPKRALGPGERAVGHVREATALISSG
jgi:hypothetical protein